MIVRALDSNGDWTFGKGRNDYLSQKKALAQNIKTRLSSFLGDCFFAVQDGIDWFNLLGAKNVDAIKRVVSVCLINTENVTALLEVSVTLDQARNLHLVYSVNTSFGVITENEILTVSDAIITEDGDIITTEDGDIIVTE